MKKLTTTLFISAALLAWGCDGSEKQRPEVHFDHAAHDKALEGKCEPCHDKGEDGLTLTFKGAAQIKDRDTRTDLFHARCMGCHKETAAAGKESGPRTCAGCHKEARAAEPAMAAMRFDSSLHARHVEATGGEKKCDTCHEKGKPEQALSGDKDRAHAACVGCHLENQGKDTGPVKCAGCHDAAEQAKIEKVKAPPRLMARQKDFILLKTKGGKAEAVPFDHKAHEGVGFCTTCHTRDVKQHETTEEGCVSCHQKTIKADAGCKGCHGQVPASRQGKGCETCHAGAAQEEAPAAAMPASSDDFDCASLRRQNLTSAPDTAGCTSPDMFPEVVKIGHLSKEYAPSDFPHRKVVAALLKAANASNQGRRCHAGGGTETLCAGCHHESKGAGKRPPACKSCHGATAHPEKDQPGLKAAYHRQCLGCHQTMGLKQTGCTDCHAKKEEVAK